MSADAMLVCQPSTHKAMPLTIIQFTDLRLRQLLLAGASRRHSVAVRPLDGGKLLPRLPQLILLHLLALRHGRQLLLQQRHLSS